MILSDSPASINEAVRLLKQGGLIAFPTETYYGLGVDPFNIQALQRLFAVKGRQTDKAILVLTENPAQLPCLVQEIPPPFHHLMQQFWPGPLTLVCPARSEIPAALTSGSGTIGVRQSSHVLAARLVQTLGGPITATSANLSGAVPAVTARQVQEFFGDQLDCILDGGPTPGGAASTLVAWDGQKLCCLRDGVLPFKTLLAAFSSPSFPSGEKS
jgi:L-threonylcarbamoyladenylate synthase